MAQQGDTITYTFTNNTDDNNRLIPVEEDVSNIDEATVEYCKGADGGAPSDNGIGGLVENATIDVSNESTLYIWVASNRIGRYKGGNDGAGYAAGGSTEVAFVNTNAEDSADEPFLVGAGGGGTVWSSGFFKDGGGGGGRGGDGGFASGNGTAPPQGGTGAESEGDGAGDGDGAIDDQNRGLVTGGTTTKGGSDSGTDGEIKISYESTLSPPDPPSNLNASVQ